MGSTLSLAHSALQTLLLLSKTYETLLKRLRLSPGIPLPNPSEPFWAFPPATIQRQGAESASEFPGYADVVIIGSGITATSFAREFLDNANKKAKEGLGGTDLKVVMLEARDACSGATARNGGHITPLVFHDYQELVEKYGPAAQQLIRFRLMHLPNLLDVAKAERVLEYSQCREVDTFDVFFDQKMFDDAKMALDKFKKDMPVEGGRFTVYEAKEASEKLQVTSQTLGAIHTRAGAVNAYRLVTSILSRLLSSYPNAFYMFTHTPCTSITAPSTVSPNYYTLHTPKGRLMTPRVIHATNGWASHLLEPMRTKIIPARGTMSAQRPGKGLAQSDLFTPSSKNDADMANINDDRTYVFYNTFAYDYLTQLPTPQRELMFGGGFAVGGIDEIGNVNDREYNVSVASHLSGALSVHFGERRWGEETSPGQGPEEDGWNKGRVKALWSGILGGSADWLPWVGRLPPKVSGRKQPAPCTQTPSTLVVPIRQGRAESEDKNGISLATDPSTSPDFKVPSESTGAVTLAPPGEWIAAGYTGEGMVYAWMSGKALAGMVLGREGDEWFPDIMRVTERRWRKARIEDLLSKFAKTWD